MISIPGSLSFVMSSAPGKKFAGDPRYESQYHPWAMGNMDFHLKKKVIFISNKVVMNYSH